MMLFFFRKAEKKQRSGGTETNRRIIGKYFMVKKGKNETMD
jgi:hypothetical protein